MNANEHLDFYNPDSIYYGNSRHYIQQLEAMLRQQQAEIEALKSVVYWLKENRPEVWDDIQKWRKYEPKR